MLLLSVDTTFILIIQTNWIKTIGLLGFFACKIKDLVLIYIRWMLLEFCLWSKMWYYPEYNWFFKKLPIGNKHNMIKNIFINSTKVIKCLKGSSMIHLSRKSVSGEKNNYSGYRSSLFHVAFANFIHYQKFYCLHFFNQIKCVSALKLIQDILS